MQSLLSPCLRAALGQIANPAENQCLVLSRSILGPASFAGALLFMTGALLGRGRMHVFPNRDMAMAQSGLTGLPRSGKNDNHATASASVD
ncbi:hypothetical protein PWG15_09215 [Ensifer adhaerens]|uniref:hypothetical protein n=1 Tax=Ensifer adhaerens TaxID=106592 RepID=UPI0023A942EE|nr:hypothetical protein [Ensifer adhaerens]WDZ78646.1 hypothetical protein PWG15_09215 [Ensifer adhaerens]